VGEIFKTLEQAKKARHKLIKDLGVDKAGGIDIKIYILEKEVK
jgi:hypothetical protein